MWAVLWKVAPVRRSLLCYKHRKCPSDVTYSTARGEHVGFEFTQHAVSGLNHVSFKTAPKTSPSTWRSWPEAGGGEKQGLKNCSWLPSCSPSGSGQGRHRAACACCPDTWIKKERGVYEWYVLLTYPIHFLLKPESCPSAESSPHTVKLFHSAGRHFVNISQASEIGTKASFIRTFFKQKLRSCGEKKECSVVGVSGKSEVNLKGESGSIAETLNIKWAIWFGQLAWCTSGVRVKPEAGGAGGRGGGIPYCLIT